MNRIALTLLAGAAALGFASSTQAADLIVDYAPMSPGVVDVSGDWDGPFVGVFGGYGMGDADHVSGPGTNDLELSGWLLGVNAGVNFTLTEGIIAGVVGDIAWSDIGGEITGGAFDGTEHTINWQGSVRGRIGFDGGAFMPYLTAGLAFANATRHTDLFGGDDADATHIGWTAGAGVEVAVAENVSLDLQYRYTDLGEQEYVWPDIAATDPTIALTTHALTVGLNFSF
jgi:outer membrane immunogenic protein